MSNLEQALSSVRRIAGEQWRPRVAVVIGSGLDSAIGSFEVDMEIPYESIDGFPQSSAPAHKGCLLVARHQTTDIAVFQGRFHLYEGWSPFESAMPSYLARKLGVKTIVFTNAVGALNPEWRERELVLVQDHLNFTGQSPLRGENDDSLGPRFPDMSEPYKKDLQAVAEQAAEQLGMTLRKGVYGGVSGPELETSAERRFLRMAGADVVGMSLIMESIAANHCGLDVMGLSAITNGATGLEDQQADSIEAVLANAAVAAEQMGLLLPTILDKLSS